MRSAGRLVFAVVVSLTAAGCVTSPSSIDLLGRWGGSHLVVDVTSTGAQLQYDCAEGVIEEPIRPDAEGRFSAAGSHTPGHGGPVRIGEVLPAYRAQYDGEVDGDQMTLRVTLVETGVVLGSFEIRRGSAGMLVRCL